MTNEEFLKNLTEIKSKNDFSQMTELTVKNKLIRNISNSNILALGILHFSSLSIINCKMQSINKGEFNLMLNLMT